MKGFLKYLLIGLLLAMSVPGMGQGSMRLSGLTLDGSIDPGIRVVCVDSTGTGYNDYQVRWQTLLNNVGLYVYNMSAFRDSLNAHYLQGDGSAYAIPVYSSALGMMNSNLSDSGNNHCTVNDTLIVKGQLRLDHVGLAALQDSPLVMGLTYKDVRKINPPIGELGVIFRYPGDTVLGDSTFFIKWDDTLPGNRWIVTPHYLSSLGYGSVTSVTAGTGLSGGTITTSGTISLPNVGTAGTYGSASLVPVFTTDAEGRVTGVTNTAVSAWSNGKYIGLTSSNAFVDTGVTGIWSAAESDSDFATQANFAASYTGTLTPTSSFASADSRIVYDDTAQSGNLYIAAPTGNVAPLQMLDIIVYTSSTVNFTFNSIYKASQSAIPSTSTSGKATEMIFSYEYLKEYSSKVWILKSINVY